MTVGACGAALIAMLALALMLGGSACDGDSGPSAEERAVSAAEAAKAERTARRERVAAEFKCYLARSREANPHYQRGRSLANRADEVGAGQPVASEEGREAGRLFDLAAESTSEASVLQRLTRPPKALRAIDTASRRTWLTLPSPTMMLVRPCAMAIWPAPSWPPHASAGWADRRETSGGSR